MEGSTAVTKGMNENVVAFDAGNGMLDGDAHLTEGAIVGLLVSGESRLRIMLTLARLFAIDRLFDQVSFASLSARIAPSGSPVCGRVDWKYLLGLELTDPGFHFSVLSEFRQRLLQGQCGSVAARSLLERCHSLGLLKTRGQQRTAPSGPPTRVVAAIRVLNRLELMGETLRAALNELATMAPEWLRQVAPSAWYERYSRQVNVAVSSMMSQRTGRYKRRSARDDAFDSPLHYKC